MVNLQNSSPLVSVIVPAYNAERFIQRTLNSILAQTYQNLEVIVVDDGSTDRTADIIREIAQQDNRVTLLQQSNSGVAAARNLGIQYSKGEFIAPIDADDIWHSKNLEKQIQCFAESNSNVGLVYSWSFDINEHDLPIGEIHTAQIEGDVYLTLFCHYFLSNASASLIRRSCLQKIGAYNCQFKKHNAQGCEDWELCLRIAKEFEFRFVPELLVGYRKIQTSMSCNYDSMARSHELMLQFIQQEQPKLPNFICRLSSSSFYIYLARQCNQYYDYKGVLVCLKKALENDFITPFLRIELYMLLIKSLLKLHFQSTDYLTKSNHRVYRWLQRKYKSSCNMKPVSKSGEQNLHQSKSLLEILLHRVLPILVLMASQVEKKVFQDSLGYRRSL